MTTSPASRLLALILLLQREPNQKAACLASQLGISIRTLHRDFAKLDELGIPVYAERGPQGGFSLVRGYRMPPLMFNPEEATVAYLGAYLVDDLWGSLYHDAAQSTLVKLDNLLPVEQRQEAAWARQTLVAYGLRRAGLEKLAHTMQLLRKAIHDQHRVKLLYQSSSVPGLQSRELDPYGLVYRWGWWVLVGYCHLRRELRSFRIDRIQECTPGSQNFKIPTDFDIQAYLANEFQGQSQIQVCLRFLPEGVPIAQSNRLYWDSFEPQVDGSVDVTFSSPDLEWAASSVLAYGPAVEVIQPQELRTLILQWAGKIVRSYTNGG